MQTDLTAEALPAYRSTQSEPADFDEFWATTLAATRAHDLNLTVTRAETALSTLDVYDVTFAGFNGDPVKAWLKVPVGSINPLPTIIEFVGYGGGRGLAEDRILIPSAGFAHFLMDTRGQGSGWSVGATADPHGSHPHIPGFLTSGVLDKEGYYYRRVFADAVRAVEAARSIEVVDASRVGLYGGSQGGGIALATTALVGDAAASVILVPFLSDIRRATLITDSDPYHEVTRFLAIHRLEVERVHETLSYVDGVNFAKRAITPALFTAALMDPICPPSTVYGSFNNYGGEKSIELWPYNGHEGGGLDGDLRALEFFRRLL